MFILRIHSVFDVDSHQSPEPMEFENNSKNGIFKKLCKAECAGQLDVTERQVPDH